MGNSCIFGAMTVVSHTPHSHAHTRTQDTYMHIPPFMRARTHTHTHTTHTHTHTGHPLTLKQEDIGIKGWAVEARVYAEVRYTEHLVRLGLKSAACQLGHLHLSLISATILPFSSSLPLLCIPSSPLSLSPVLSTLNSFPRSFSSSNP